MEKAFRLKIVTPEKPIYEGDVVSVIARGEMGYLGVLSNHAPLVTNLIPGKLIYRDAQGATKTMRLGDGYLEVLNNCLTVLTASAI